MSKKEQVKLLTPFGVSKFTYLHAPYKPKNVRSGEEKKLKYKVNLLLDPDNNSEHKAFLGQLKKMTEEKGGEVYPFERDYTVEKHDDGTKTKTYTDLWAVKMHTTFKPNIFDSAMNPIEVEVGNGSVIRCSVTVDHFEAFARTPAGMTLYLQGVQVRELKSIGGRSAADLGFDEVKDGYTDDGYTGASDFAEQARTTDEPEDFDAGSSEEFDNSGIPTDLPF